MNIEMYNIANRLLQKANKLNLEGFTVEIARDIIKDYNKSSGYVVSLITLIKAYYINKELINYEIVYSEIPLNCIIGGWYDKDKEVYLIELNGIIKDKNYALQIAKKYNQKCIWDIANNKEIKV